MPAEFVLDMLAVYQIIIPIGLLLAVYQILIYCDMPGRGDLLPLADGLQWFCCPYKAYRLT